MCFEAVNWAIKQHCENTSQKLILIMLANHKNSVNHRCNPSYKLMAAECCMSLRTVIKNTQALEKQGFIKISQITVNNCRLPNQYELKIHAIKPDYANNNQAKNNAYEPVFNCHADTTLSVMQSLHECNADYAGVVMQEVQEVGVEPTHEYKNITNTSLSLATDEKNCLAWAKESNFWGPLIVSHEKFIELYNSQKPNGLKSQYEAQLLSTNKKDPRNAHKNNGYTGLSKTKLTPAEEVARAAGFKRD
ncbi:MAG: hypothetical protein RIQ94_375 [Pseudomonadota bacterium]|jgi:hypothetical protein